MSHKAGFVNIIGKPNVGKSTLMNALMGEKLSIITPKAQTTRHRIKGIISGDDYQIVLSDTPGVIDPAYLLHNKMMDVVFTALEDADVLLLIFEIGETAIHDKIKERLNNLDAPLIVLINKVDLGDQDKVEASVDHWKKTLPSARVLPISALHKFQIDELKNIIISMLPESPPYFAKDELTDRSERFFISEIIREKILKHYAKEIPYSCEVAIESWEESEEITRMRAVIYVARESQKGIMIGHKGLSLKRVGTEARKDAERFLNTKVYLELYVKVKDNWRESDRDLNRFGYDFM